MSIITSDLIQSILAADPDRHSFDNAHHKAIQSLNQEIVAQYIIGYLKGEITISGTYLEDSSNRLPKMHIANIAQIIRYMEMVDLGELIRDGIEVDSTQSMQKLFEAILNKKIKLGMYDDEDFINKVLTEDLQHIRRLFPGDSNNQLYAKALIRSYSGTHIFYIMNKLLRTGLSGEAVDNQEECKNFIEALILAASISGSFKTADCKVITGQTLYKRFE